MTEHAAGIIDESDQIDGRTVDVKRAFGRSLTNTREMRRRDLEEALCMGLVGRDQVERRRFEGFFEMGDGCQGSKPVAAGSGLPWRRTNRCQCGSNRRLGLKKSFPDSRGGRVAHGELLSF
ncbi:hypothetical protein [Stieleria varia]|uniref:hypothetical protein n=1 Tax=Stieleria varia TaxID=2528005 RepID=UPI0011B366EB|nr:hypothetical protein [Stieleria varia]